VGEALQAAGYAPIYRDDKGNRFAILNGNFVVDDPADLVWVRINAFTITCGIGLTMTREVLDLSEPVPHILADLWHFSGALLSGPEFDRLSADTPARDGEGRGEG
jgi:hypothetical protein